LKLRGRLTGAGVLLFLAGVAALLLAPGRLPWGYWVAVAAWAWLTTAILKTNRKRVALRALAVGVIVYLLLTLVPLAANLETREGYTRAFYLAVIACTTAWAIGWLRRRGATCDTLDLLAFPAVLATGTVAAAAFHHDPLSATIGLATGGALGLLVWATPRIGAAHRSSGL
jgi:hypothetical protein